MDMPSGKVPYMTMHAPPATRFTDACAQRKQAASPYSRHVLSHNFCIRTSEEAGVTPKSRIALPSPKYTRRSTELSERAPTQLLRENSFKI